MIRYHTIRTNGDQWFGSPLLSERWDLILRHREKYDRMADFLLCRRNVHEKCSDTMRISKDIQRSSLRFGL